MTNPKAELILGYQQWGERLVAEGWTPYLMSFMYHDLRGSDANVLAQMEKEVERVYATHLTRVIRKPTAPSSIGRLPVWMCSPDRPVFKHGKQNCMDVTVNDGRHMHAVAFDPPSSRLSDSLDVHFNKSCDLYIRPNLGLVRIHVAAIIQRVGHVIDYALKHVGRGLIGQDAMLILPRSFDEVRDRAA